MGDHQNPHLFTFPSLLNQWIVSSIINHIFDWPIQKNKNLGKNLHSIFHVCIITFYITPKKGFGFLILLTLPLPFALFNAPLKVKLKLHKFEIEKWSLFVSLSYGVFHSNTNELDSPKWGFLLSYLVVHVDHHCADIKLTPLSIPH